MKYGGTMFVAVPELCMDVEVDVDYQVYKTLPQDRAEGMGEFVLEEGSIVLNNIEDAWLSYVADSQGETDIQGEGKQAKVLIPESVIRGRKVQARWIGFQDFEAFVRNAVMQEIIEDDFDDDQDDDY